MNEREKRHEELSAKIFNMGRALMKEGETKGDYIIANVGNFMIFISGVMYDEEDVNFFNEIFGMFSAKKLLESRSNLGKVADMDSEELFKTINKLRDEINGDSNNDEDEDEKNDEDE